MTLISLRHFQVCHQGHDSVEGFKARRGKAYDSIYDFTNYGTLGASDAIWSGAQDRTAKRKDSFGDYLNYWTLGFTDTIVGAVNPDDPFSSDHLLNSFGLATSFTGVGKVVTTKPTSSVSGASKPKETGEGSRLATSRTIISTEMEAKILEGKRKVPKNNLIGGHSARINNANDNFAVEVLSTNVDGTKSVVFTKQFPNDDISKLKKSTLFPETWSDERILKNIIVVGNTPALSIRLRDKATWHRGIINGIEIDVIKIGDDVTSGYPTGSMNAPRPSGF